jgi:hypothetical protein
MKRRLALLFSGATAAIHRAILFSMSKKIQAALAG